MKLKRSQKERVNQCIAKILLLQVDDIKPTDTFYDDYRFDSLDTIELIMEIESEFGITEPFDFEAETVKTVQDAYDLLATLL